MRRGSVLLVGALSGALIGFSSGALATDPPSVQAAKGYSLWARAVRMYSPSWGAPTVTGTALIQSQLSTGRTVFYNAPIALNTAKVATFAKAAMKAATPAGLAWQAAIVAAGYFLDQDGEIAEETPGPGTLLGEYAPQQGESTFPARVGQTLCNGGTGCSVPTPWPTLAHATRWWYDQRQAVNSRCAFSNPVNGCYVKKVEGTTVYIQGTYNGADYTSASLTFYWVPLAGDPTPYYLPGETAVAELTDEELIALAPGYTGDPNNLISNSEGVIEPLLLEGTVPEILEDPSIADMTQSVLDGTSQSTDPQGANYVPPDLLPLVQKLAAAVQVASSPTGSSTALNADTELVDLSSAVAKGVREGMSATEDGTAWTGPAGPECVATWWLAAYPEGLQGIWTARKDAIQSSGLVAWLSNWGIPETGTEPVWVWNANVGVADFGTYEISVPGWVWLAVKGILLVTALFAARRLIFGG